MPEVQRDIALEPDRAGQVSAGSEADRSAALIGAIADCALNRDGIEMLTVSFRPEGTNVADVGIGSRRDGRWRRTLRYGEKGEERGRTRKAKPAANPVCGLGDRDVKSIPVNAQHPLRGQSHERRATPVNGNFHFGYQLHE